MRIVEKDGATTLSDHRYVWLGSTIAERRNAAGDTVQIRYLGVGEVEGATKRYYTRDHLGSIREVVSQTGGVLARYDYSPFGERVRVGGSDAAYVCSFGYTGHFQHIPTGMALTWFRAYVPGSGRWLSRDPIGEMGGLNLYGYVGNRSINSIDPLGLCDPITAALGSIGVVLAPEAVAAIGVGLSVVVGGTIGYFLPMEGAGFPNAGVGWNSMTGPMYPMPGSQYYYDPSRPLNTQSTLNPMKDVYPTPEDAIGQDAFGGITKVGTAKTKNEGLRAQGFKTTETYKDCKGKNHTVHVHENGGYAGAHDSTGLK